MSLLGTGNQQIAISIQWASFLGASKRTAATNPCERNRAVLSPHDSEWWPQKEAINEGFPQLACLAQSARIDAYELSITSKFPREEIFGLTKQIRRCSGSVPANLAEGCGRRGNGEFHRRFLQIAAGSASELEYHLLLAKDLRYLVQEDYDDIQAQIIEVKKMLGALISKVERERLRVSER